jgi:hypothetical protein
MKIIAATLALTALVGFAAPRAQAATNLSHLAGPWTATIIGSTGCGFTSIQANFTLNTSGQGTATETFHTAACGDSTVTAPISFSYLSSNGAGIANLSCGQGCGWVLNVQVAGGNKVFNLVDVSPDNPNNYIQGTAVHQQ